MILAGQVDHAFEMAAYLSNRVAEHKHFVLISENPPPCLQVCFYWAREGKLKATIEENTQVTRSLTRKLIDKGFMVDYAPGDSGSFFRVVVNRETRRETIDKLIIAIEDLGTATGDKE